MTTFALSFALLLAAVAAMAVGRLWGRPPLRACCSSGDWDCAACPKRARGQAP